MKKLLYLACMAPYILMSCSAPAAKEGSKQRKFCIDDVMRKELTFDTAFLQPVTEDIHLTGKVEANPDKVVAFRSLFSGIVSNTYFSMGDSVRKGQLLAEIRSTEYTSLHAGLQSLESRLSVAETRLKSVRAMYNDKMASQKELEEAQSDFDILKVEIAKVNSDKDMFSANSSKNVFQVKAPASGYITGKAITNGMQVTQNESDPLFTISNIDEVWVMANIYTSNMQDVKTGMPVEIRSLSWPGEVFRGKISMIGKVMDAETKVFKARIVLDNRNAKLNPGMLADIVAVKALEKKAVAVPVSAIIFSDNEYYVLVYKHECDVEARKIKILSSNHSMAYIEEGLAENEVILSKNLLILFNSING